MKVWQNRAEEIRKKARENPAMFVGADGCKTGWFTVRLTEDNNWEIGVFPDVSSLWNKYRSASVILLDIPIGLRDGGDERKCDKAARKLLSPRTSSVFPVPCREAIYAKRYKKASTINKQRTRRRLSLQTWNIIPKIRQVDILLSRDESARSRVREIHPEICFWALAGGHPMKHSKGEPKGIEERTKVLKSLYPWTEDILSSSTCWRKGVARDDVLDALSAAVTAMEGMEKLLSLPETPEFDSHGLRMEMVYRCPSLGG